jgi:uncharacterized glyoxalase superfamily protein PhnB
MKQAPKGWPRISSAVFYQDPARAIDWLCTAFGFEVRLKVEGEGGRIEHSELVYGEGLIMVGGNSDTKPKFPFRKSPREVGGHNTQCLMVFVDDADAHCKHARAQGATIVQEPETHDYGDDYWSDRSYEVIDLEGHHWWFTQRVRG